MELPIGMLIYWAHRFEEDHAVISGMWYYKEMYVPSSIEEKKNSVSDLKEKRCTVLNVNGQFDQIMDILIQCDRFQQAGPYEISQFNILQNEISNLPKNKAYLFHDINNLKGTSLMLDTVVEVDETLEDIMAKIKKGKVVGVTISKNWSFADDLLKKI